MTMLIDESGRNIQVVEPGSSDDPFAAKNQVVSQEGATQVPAGDGPKLAPETPATITPQPVPVAEPVSVTPQVPVVEEKKPVEELVTKTELEKLIRSQQSNYDKQITKLNESLKAERERATKLERESKLSSEDLTDEEKELLRGKFDLEDQVRQVEEREAETEKFFRTVFIAKAVLDNEQYGVTAEALEALEEPEDIEAYCLRAQLDFYKSGKATVVPQSTQVVTPPVTPPVVVPAGAQAPSDLGGTGVSAPAPSLSKGTGLDAMMESLRAIPETRFNFN